jgi:hypothetical protein
VGFSILNFFAGVSPQVSRRLLEDEFPVEASVLDEIESQSVEKVGKDFLPMNHFPWRFGLHLPWVMLARA